MDAFDIVGYGASSFPFDKGDIYIYIHIYWVKVGKVHYTRVIRAVITFGSVTSFQVSLEKGKKCLLISRRKPKANFHDRLAILLV